MKYDILRLFSIIVLDLKNRMEINAKMFKANIYKEFANLLQSDTTEIRFMIMHILIRILFENSDQIKPIIDSELIKTLIFLLNDDSNKMKCLALNILNRTISAGSEQQLLYLCLNGVISRLLNFLNVFIDDKNYIRTLEHCITAVFLIYKFIKCNIHSEQIISQIIQSNILEKN